MASIYWYVASKEELLDRATDQVLVDVLADTEEYSGAPDPISDVRSILDGTASSLPSTPSDPNTRDYPWREGVPYRLRISR